MVAWNLKEIQLLRKFAVKELDSAPTSDQKALIEKIVVHLCQEEQLLMEPRKKDSGGVYPIGSSFPIERFVRPFEPDSPTPTCCTGSKASVVEGIDIDMASLDEFDRMNPGAEASATSQAWNETLGKRTVTEPKKAE